MMLNIGWVQVILLGLLYVVFWTSVIKLLIRNRH